MTGAGETIQTLADDPAVLGSVLGDTASLASGVSEVNFAYSAATYAVGAVGCAAGAIG